MSYGTVYTLPFKSIKGKDYLIKIEREGYAGAATELKGQRSPFTVSVDGEDGFIYQPARFSTATLSIFGGDYLQDLFSTDYRMHRVTLYEGGVAAWCGFIKPEMYTQDYRSVKFPLDLECYSAMSVLEYIDYKQQGDTRGFVSLWALLKHCISESRGQYTAVYLPHVYGKDKSAFEAWENPLEQMSVSEQNFFDEDNEPMKLKEVLEEIMKLLNWTCNDWQGELYFTDADNEDGNYYKYDLAMESYTKVKANSVTVQEAGFSGADHTLDIVPGYNKATVRCSNYPVGEALPELSFDELTYLTTKDQKYHQSVTGGYKVRHYKFYKSVNPKYELKTYRYGSNPDEVTEVSADEAKQMIEETPTWELASLTGCIPFKYDEYNEDKDGEADITDYEYTEQLYIKTNRGTANHTLIFSQNNRIPVMIVKGVPAAYSNGAFSIYFNLKMFATMTGGLDDYDFHFQLRIGNKYFHGSDNGFYWDENPEVVTGEYTNNLWVDFKDTNADTFEGPYEIQTKGRKLNDGLDGVKGYVCRLPEEETLFGDLEFTLYAPYASFTVGSVHPDYFALHDFDFAYNKYEDTAETEDSDSDRIYENTINEDYINELDEIEMKLSSYNNDGACYSKVMLGDNYLENNLYCGITGGNIRPEELLIRRIIDHYSATKIKLTQVLKKAAIKPFTILSDKYMDDKKFMNIGGEIDYKMNRFTCIMLEI